MIDSYDSIFLIESQCKGKTKGEILAIRETMLPRFKEMKILAESRLAELSEKSALGRAYSYFTRNFEQLIYLIRDPDVPMTNNQLERLLRSPVIGRETWHGTHSERGSVNASIHQTFPKSCKLIDLNPREYYRDSVFIQLQKLPPLTPNELKALPALKKNGPPTAILRQT